MTKKILIIKLGALGDILRTFPLAKAIKEEYSDSEITWITRENALDLFKGNPYIDRIFTIPNYPNEFFDILYNFDIDEEATKLASEINSEKKYGFYSYQGYPMAFNIGSEYYLSTFFDDELKKNNKKTYQEIMFEAAELPYKKQHDSIYLTEEEKNYAKEFIITNNIDIEKLIGIHIGASQRWPSKVWNKENVKQFIIKAKEKGYNILLFWGPDEVMEHENLYNELKKNGIEVYKNDSHSSLRKFVSLVDICKMMVCSDSLALHVSLALKKPTIGLFFCTSPNEVEDYGLLKKIISPFLDEFFPEKMDQYDGELTKSISPEEVFNIITSLEKVPIRVVNAIIKHPYEEKFLIIKRKEGIHQGKWAFPGGIVEEGESEEDALKRELVEETGLELSSIIKKISEYSYLREDKTETIGNCFFVATKNFNVVINEEIEEFKWVSLEELKFLDHLEGIDDELLLTF